ncbi:MAG: histone deacetylase family protein [Parachlamydiaceae bacterium]|nr:histone deacetylase family protein [Parachlamydiaceae bacterium]
MHITGEGHPESPQRYTSVIEELTCNGLMKKENSVLAQEAPLSAILRCHPQTYIDLVKAECRYHQQLKLPPGKGYLSTGDVKICSDSYAIALLAAGAGLIAVDAVMQKKSKTAFCVIRPPGHHATSTQGMGFCLFNNVAIAARYAQAIYKAKKVLIADWDVHHGNGTQEIFFSDPSVFYFSTHQEGIYPGSGKREEIGAGTIHNAPLKGGPGSRISVLKVYEEELFAAMEIFKPDLILLSAGFDAHKDDPIGGMDLITEDFVALTRSIKKIADKYCDGRIVSLLEGGYNLEALRASASAHVKELSMI